MSKQMLFQHEWKISGLNSVCDKITGHPFIGSPVKDDDLHLNNNNSFYVYLSSKGYDQPCADYVSLWFSKYQDENCQIECKISILNNRGVTLFAKDVIIIDNNTYLNEYIQRDYLFDPANGLMHNDEFILHFEGWTKKKKRSSILGNNPPVTKDHFDFALLPKCANKFGLKWTIDNVDELIIKNKQSNQILELPKYEDCGTNNEDEGDKMIISPSIEIVKEKSKSKRLVFDIKTNFCAPMNVETSIVDLLKHKIHSKMSAHVDKTHFRYFINHKHLYMKHLLVSKNKLIFFTEITRITDIEICSKDNNNKYNYLQMLSYFESSSSSSDLKITEFKIDAKTGEIFTLNPEIEKLEKLENIIEEQTTVLDNIINNVTNIFHEHYFENANLNGVLVNTNSQSNFGNVSIAQTDCTVLIEKLEEIVIREIKPVLDQNEQMCSEIKEIKSCNEVLVNVSLENQLEIAHLQTELNQMKRDKQVKQSKMKQIVERIIALLSRIKCELIKVGSNIKSIVTQAKKSTSKSTSNQPNLIGYIKSHTSSLIKFVQDVPISQSITNKTKQTQIAKLKNVKKFLISNLPTENSSNQNPEEFNLDSITMENYPDKIYDLIYNPNVPSDIDYKSILMRLNDLFTYGE